MFFEKTVNHSLSLINQAKKSLGAEKPLLILGLSGGPDSVFLFHVLLELRKREALDFIAAHLDHGWRETSAQDATFCLELCQHNNVKIIVENAHNLSSVKDTGSREDYGRRLRRQFFERLKQENNAHFIALGHHADDQIETFFIRLIRGTTLSGLHGMEDIDGLYLRPLLTTKKTDILHYLADQQIHYRIDETNEADDYLRNRIRKYVVPALQVCDNRFDESFQKTLTALKQEDKFLTSLTDNVFKEIFTLNKEKMSHLGNLTKFKKNDTALQKRLLIHWFVAEKIPFSLSSGLIDEILRFILSHRGGKHMVNNAWTLHKKNNFMWIEKT